MQVLKTRPTAAAKMVRAEERRRAREAEKRAGTYIHRKVLNAKAWVAWAEAAGIPNIVPAEEMHITILNSPIEVKVRPMTEPITAYTDRAAIVSLGPKGDALCVAINTWYLADRHYDICSAGHVYAHETWTAYRPHVTLSMDAAGYEVPDEVMAQMPETFIFGGEIHGPSRQALDYEENEMVEFEMAASLAAEELENGLVSGDLSLFDEMGLREAVKTGKFATFKGIETRFIDKAMGPEDEEDGDEDDSLVEKTSVEKTLTMTVGQLPKKVAKAVKAAELFKADEEERLVIGWASVATVKGEPVVDLQGDTITVKAQRQFLHSLIRGQRAGKFEHEGNVCNEIVEGIILDASLQKALGIDLGMEGMLVVTHVPNDADWEMVKSGDWMYSIAGTVLVEE